MDFISQFTTDIRYTHGSDNPVADALSQVELNQMESVSSIIDFEAMASAQDNCKFLTHDTPQLSLPTTLSPPKFI